jgi:hypothetical protein
LRNSSDKEAQKKKRVFAFILALLVLAGCGAPAAVEPEDVSQSEVLRYALDEIELQGFPAVCGGAAGRPARVVSGGEVWMIST